MDERDKRTRGEKLPESGQDDWVDEAEEREERDDEWVEDAGAPAGGARTGWEEENARPAASQSQPKGIQAYYSWIAGLIGLIIGLLSFRACR